MVSKLEVSKPASEEKQQPEVPRNYKRMSISTSVLPPPSMPEQDFQNFFKMPSPPKETPVRAPAVQEVFFFQMNYMFCLKLIMFLRTIRSICKLYNAIYGQNTATHENNDNDKEENVKDSL